jgi:hypothetical protein
MSKVGPLVFLTDIDTPTPSQPDVQVSHSPTIVSPGKTLGVGKVSNRRLERVVA